MKTIKQSGSEKVDNNEDIRVSVVRGRKSITTTASAIPTGRKLLMASTKEILSEGEQDIG